MADATRPAIGLSIGATNLAAVTADRSVTRKPVLTLYGQRAPEVGVPSENPQLDEPGLVMNDFVNRVGSPARVVAADGSTHRSEVLVADALRALVYTATDGGPAPEAIVVTYPAHWQPAAVDALRAALGPGSGWLRDGDAVLMDDAAAAANALQTNPGLPGSGVIAVCDFGGSGTSLTLVDAANGYQRIGATVRHADFSGDLIDQALLNHVVADLSAAGSFDTSATSAIGSLTRLRADCRLAKEQLSTSTVTTLTAELPGYRGDLQLTRADLDEAIRQPLAAFISVLRDVLQVNGVQGSDVVAVAAVGGGANLPAVTTMLSD
ncbi:MAG: Hsp70 family protein, partial [Mycobacterium sp.]|uniref:Hsp70 family protein n=1 Tax=Mycobacterium sp. TaxID=1785 RepID=UPI003CC6A222